MSWLGLAQRTAIVTGGASGIGRAVVRALKAADCQVVSLDLPKYDVTRRDQVDEAIRNSNAASILVNCAGITRDGFATTMAEDDWDRVIDVNLKGTFNTCQSFLINLSEDVVNATIVNVGSIVSERGNIGQANYAASKGGVLGLTRALAKEAAGRGVRVNAVVPGFIETPMTQAVPEKILSTMKSRISLGRFGHPEDVADLVAFLASDRSKYITGEAIECSGMISL